ncbi:hypothetical protein ABZ767_23175 [Streptomyces pseudogriseolus]|uniref:hypothetical protein n=1 Tax=Streptomyces TaxID=1883 RepID=UPI0004C4E083|nr:MULTISPECIES: hypothetical protein [unclassified Streptomyces]MCI4143546.1 hypothetical protein [Streptomyces sp. MMS20-AI2-20]MCM3296825.1 hypothetical protein [Streptomyces pseudogriseolus]GGQ09627.1 hypothetical protein GCM10010233_27880 [Streptomyces gancidicus]
MRKYQKAAVVMAMLGSVGFLGAGVSHAGDEPKFELNNKQATHCAQDNSTTGLINVDDVNVGIALLAVAKQEANDANSQACGNGLSLGGKH